MRHRKSGTSLGRNHKHRKAMFRNMARSLLTHERIRTTETKAKELSKIADKLVTLAVANDLHSRRLAYKILENHGLVQKLFDEIGPRFSAKAGGGYTRVVKLGLPRRGDCAPMAVIELVAKEGDESEKKGGKKAAKPKAKAAAPAEAPASQAPDEAGQADAQGGPQTGEAQAPAKETAPEEAAPEKAAPKKAASKETASKKAPAKKSAATTDETEASAKKDETETPKKAAPKKAPAKKTASKKPAAEKGADAEDSPEDSSEQ